MLSITNKTLIRDNIIPKVYSILGEDISFTCLYEAQFVSVKDKETILPALILKYEENGIIIDDVAGDNISSVTLFITVAVHAKGHDTRLDGGQFINGQKLAEMTASLIKKEFNANFESSVDGVALGEPVSNLTDISIPGSDRHVYAIQVEIDLLYEEKKQ